MLIEKSYWRKEANIDNKFGVFLCFKYPDGGVYRSCWAKYKTINRALQGLKDLKGNNLTNKGWYFRVEHLYYEGF